MLRIPAPSLNQHMRQNYLQICYFPRTEVKGKKLKQLILALNYHWSIWGCFILKYSVEERKVILEELIKSNI